MARNPDLLIERNLRIHERFRYHRKKNPKWMLIYVIEAVANEFFLTNYTIERVLKTPIEKPDTVQPMQQSLFNDAA